MHRNDRIFILHIAALSVFMDIFFNPKFSSGAVWRGWGDMKMKGQPNWDSNPVLPSQGSNHAYEAGLYTTDIKW